MKKLIILTFLYLTCFACETKKDEAPEIQEQTVSAPYRKSTSVTIQGQALIVNILELNDSRCPINADCIQAGSVDLQLSVSDGTNKVNIPVSFKSDSKASGHQTFLLGKQNYSLVVHEVLPYPITDRKPDPEEYKVNLSIEKI
ncbi:hypothetical protein SAMN04487995_4040 [Dyadobacter koreensis]|uniref:Uncharacterized protein n=1 Tax=Dyadobacter koreensis TaxID=408657 RepID=A0A1H6XKS3_9BACT|nr:hypothetical protein [Dyadobacter koreensis]SEJ29669.1 hypothetical protein SAMN04487995_4040 [Dyadobacter koreensis]